MTRHNLNQHLQWLLGCQPTDPPQPAYAPLATSSVEDASSIHQEAERLGLGTVIEKANKNARRSATQLEFVRPTVTASVLDTQDGQEMARLQSGPKSSNKPRLLSEHIPVALRTPPPTSLRKPGTSLKDQYSAQWERNPSGVDDDPIAFL